MSETSAKAVPSPFRRVGKGLGASSVGQAATLLSRLLELPVVIAFWGVEAYGYWLVLNVVPTLLTASDLGLGMVAARVMAQQVGRKEFEPAVRTLRSAFWVSILISLLLGALTLVCLQFDVIRGWLGLGDVPVHVTMIVTLLLSMRTVLQLGARVLQGGLSCVGRYPRAMLLAGLTNLLSLLGFYATAIFGGQMILAAAVQLVVSAGGMVVMHRAMRQGAPWLQIGLPRLFLHPLKVMYKPALADCIISLSRSANYSLPRLIVASFMGPTAVAVFTAHRQLARFINFMLLFAGPFQAELALIYRGEGQEFSDFSRRVVQIFVWISIGSTVAVALVGGFFFDLWVHKTFALQVPLFTILIATTFLETLGTIVLMPAFAVNAHVSVAKVFVIANVIALGASVLMIRWLGLDGLGLSLLAVDASVCFASCRLYASLVHLNVNKAVMEAFIPPVWLLKATKKAAIDWTRRVSISTQN